MIGTSGVCYVATNRTNLELKREWLAYVQGRREATNRTNLELKPYENIVFYLFFPATNRTNLELKRNNFHPHSNESSYYQSYQSGIETAVTHSTFAS